MSVDRLSAANELSDLLERLRTEALQQRPAGVDEAVAHQAAFFELACEWLRRVWTAHGLPGEPPLDHAELSASLNWFQPSPRLLANASLTCRATAIDEDLLGTLYESQLDSQDRKNKGQFYTPRNVVRFIWDRVGFQPRRGESPIILDLCTGSGGFLLEAARRIRLAAEGDADWAVNAIVSGLRGCERTPFAKFLTEVNLLIQLALSESRVVPPVTNIVRADALGLHNGANLPDGTAGGRRIAEERHADFICCNPPYLGEKSNKELFRDVRDRWPYWRNHYLGKMDYWYWFLILALSKLRDGGRAGFITTGYWHTADGGASLRRYLLDHARLVELIDLGETRVFSDAKGQHNHILILDRCQDSEARRRHRPKLIQVKGEPEGDSRDDRVQRLLDHIGLHAAIGPDDEFEDDLLRVFWSPVTQGELTAGPWHLFHDREIETRLRSIAAAGEPLSWVLEDSQGVVSGLDEAFVLTQRQVDSLGLNDAERRLLRRCYKNSQVRPYVVDTSDSEPEYLLYIVRGVEFSPAVTPQLWRHLEPFRDSLSRKREATIISQETGLPRRHWYELHWPRDERLLRGEKLVTSRRSATNRFAWQTGEWFENSDLTLLSRRPGVREDLRYFLALLNSSTLDDWCEHRGKKKGRLREYYSTPLQAIPLRRIRFTPATAESIRAAELAAIRRSLAAGDADDIQHRLLAALAAGREDLVHDGLVLLTDLLCESQDNSVATWQPVVNEVVSRVYSGG